MRWFRFKQSVQREGRYFAEGAVVQGVSAGIVTVILPSLEVRKSACVVPTSLLDIVFPFDALIVNTDFPQAGDIVIYGTCKDDAIQSFIEQNPGCSVLDIVAQ